MNDFLNKKCPLKSRYIAHSQILVSALFDSQIRLKIAIIRKLKNHKRNYLNITVISENDNVIPTRQIIYSQNVIMDKPMINELKFIYIHYGNHPARINQS